MNIKEIKKLGAPFRGAEVQVSLRKKIARLVLLIADGPNNPVLDMPIGDEESHEEVGVAVIEAAKINGLLDERSVVVIVDLDSAVAN
jgi:hypothetical protein